MSGKEGVIHTELVVPGVLSSLEAVHAWALSSLGELQLGENVVHNILLAISEAVTNAIRHGCQECSDRAVQLAFDASPEKIEIVVQDEGEGFDPAAVPDPTLGERLYQPGGRGIYLIRALASELAVERVANGTRVFVRFFLPRD